ncbi:hypothetical protein BO70DRAFT_425413 [Aspergillus heteromorphus CBS 117.55]|uniref:Uncharacterized protein n=1 Tax=Aspergillus heteromorphus CBS 117.55 TaxID=1448321 RepID=A0A317X285_9EURO|nr:uncharacterized protein BO70DRAFT_425413 [Aspergillus heteromorphus CBS 117.55]PWY92744.1 hypothetical protein BO70DRAFT_425413 [Aspergillus heteromorphus CBS 117.55]
MVCLQAHLSYASWRLRVFHELFRPNPSTRVAFSRVRAFSTPAAERPLSPEASTPNASPTDSVQETAPIDNAAEPTPQNERHPPRRPSELLPHSPLITHPKPGHARLHKPKRRPVAGESDIHLNPWAQALASPVRTCKLTGTRMPSALMTKWGFVKRSEEDENMYLVPVGVMKDKLSPRTTPGPNDPSNRNENKYKNLGQLTIRIVDRLPLLRTITEKYWKNRSKKSRKTAPLAKLIPYRWKHPVGPVTVEEEGQTVWREDMPDFALRMMREEVVRALKWASDTSHRLDRKVWTAFPDVKYAGVAISSITYEMKPFERMGCSAVLVLDRNGVKPSSTHGVLPKIPTTVFISHKRKRVPVFDLTVMFSEAELRELRAHHPRFDNMVLVFRPDSKPTVNAMLLLWKLKGLIYQDPVVEPPRIRHHKPPSIWRTRHILELLTQAEQLSPEK